MTTPGADTPGVSFVVINAVLGKLNSQELVQEIVEKRNQEKLGAFPLIPIADGDNQEALRRYEFIQKFLKESKQFGAQRRDSEKKACATAMENLAITTGLMDVNRLMWQMESQKIEQIKPLMEPTILDGVSVWLTIDENGDAGIALEKAGKAIKTAPKFFAKNETFLELKATVKESFSENLPTLGPANTGLDLISPMTFYDCDGSKNTFVRRMLEIEILIPENPTKGKEKPPNSTELGGFWQQYNKLIQCYSLIQGNTCCNASFPCTL